MARPIQSPQTDFNSQSSAVSGSDVDGWVSGVRGHDFDGPASGPRGGEVLISSINPKI